MTNDLDRIERSKYPMIPCPLLNLKQREIRCGHCGQSRAVVCFGSPIFEDRVIIWISLGRQCKQKDDVSW